SRGRERALCRTLDSLLAQRLPAGGRTVELHLFLSRKPYLLDAGFADLPDGLRQRLRRSQTRPLPLQLHWVENSGPYRKLLPLLARLTPEQQALDPLLITADDDTLYPPEWLCRLVAAQERLGCVVAFRGRRLVLEDGLPAPYRAWIRQDPALLEPSLLTVPTGKDGICYRLSHLDHRVADLPTALRIAGHADDLWFKLHCLLTGTPTALLHHSLEQEFTELTPEGQPVVKGQPEMGPGRSLFLSINKRGGNDLVLERCLGYVRQLSGEAVPTALFCGSVDPLSAGEHAG
ncbi:MAG: glycosyltransferase family A protein, partial [Prochlorococcaceae cyanobacterium]